jgi:pimeloyl-ACP methyl ester carboxylesterase
MTSSAPPARGAQASLWRNVWIIKTAFRAAALAFAVGGLVRASIVAVANHTERAVLEGGGLASLGRTAASATAVGVVLVLLGAVLAIRWLRVVDALPSDTGVGSHRRRLPWPISVHRRLAGARERGFAAIAWLTGGLGAIALVTGIAGLVLERSDRVEQSELGLGLGVAASGCTVLACALAGWMADRLEELGRDRSSPFRLPISTRRRGLRAVPVLGLLALIAYPPAAITTAGIRQPIDCPGLPGGDCRRLTVVLDREEPGDGRTLSLIYRVAPAGETRQGTLFVLVGGPGGRGLSEADPLLGSLDPAVLARYDVVFFDQRGVGGSDGFDCGNAVRVYKSDLGNDGQGAGDAFVRDCLAELGSATERLPYVGTRPAAADIDALRATLHLDRVAIYAESYGTRLAQEYAARYPDRVSALILDGAIDTEQAPLDFWKESAEGFAHSLDMTLDDCAAKTACRADVAGGDPLRAWQDAFDTVGREPVKLEYPDGYDRLSVVLTRPQLEEAVSRALYEEQSRMELQRAIAAASHDDWLPLKRLSVVALPMPVTGNAMAHLEPWTPAAYDAVECADVDAPALGLPAFDRAFDEASGAGPFARLVYQDSPCLLWPRPAGGGLAPVSVPTTVPMLVLGATADPITPPGNAERIVARSPDARLILTAGGPHVSYARRSSCVDDAVRTFLLSSALPPGRVDCPGDVARDYLPMPRATAGEIASETAGIEDVARQLEALPELSSWDGLGSFRVGCSAAGYVRVYGFPGEINMLVSGCSFVPGFAVSGSGTMDPVTGGITLDVTRDK